MARAPELCPKRVGATRRFHLFRPLGHDWFSSDVTDRMIRRLVIECTRCRFRIEIKTHVQRRKCA